MNATNGSNYISCVERSDYLRHERTRNEKKLDARNHYESCSRRSSENAKKWFKTKPYNVRSDTIGKNEAGKH